VSNIMCSGYLPPYFYGGLVVILVFKTCSICVVVRGSLEIVAGTVTRAGIIQGNARVCVVDIYHHICVIDW